MSKKQLIIVGAGGFGREVLQWAEDIMKCRSDWTIQGFLDANPAALEGFACKYSILDSPDGFRPGPADLLVCAIGDPLTRMTVAASLTSRGARFATLVHPTAIVGARSVLGEGCILCPNVTVTTDVQLGRHVIVNNHATVGHDAVVGDCCSLFCHSDVTGAARLEAGVTLGSHSSILPGVKVGEFAKVGAGSIVARRVKPYTTVFGVPAKRLLTDKSAGAGREAA